MAFRQQYPLDHATHLPVLIGLGLAFPKIRRVLEVGTGQYSTPLFLYRSVFPELIELVSFEDDPEWMERCRQKIDDPRISFVDVLPQDLSRFDLIFIDNARSENRVAIIRWVRDNVSQAMVVIHDSETEVYRDEIKKFAYAYDFLGYNPETTVAWQMNPGPFEKIRPIADLIFREADSIELGPPDRWIEAFKHRSEPTGPQTLSIMMTAYDRAHLLGPSLESIRFQTRQPDQIVVVEDGNDGGKTEGVCNHYKSLGLPIEYVCRRNRPNRGFSNPAIPKNIGIKKCTGEIIIIQGAEVKYTKPTDIQNLVEPVEQNPDLSMFATCQALNPDGSFNMWYGDPAFENYLGFCHAIRKDRIVAIGGFDEGFQGYCCEDDDFSWRMRASGVVYKWATDVLVSHQWHEGHPNPDDREMEEFNKAYGGKAIEDYYKKKIRGLEANVGKEWGVL